MALNLVYPLKRGTYHRVRGFSAHVRSNPGTWYGIDEGCKTGTPLYAVGDGKVSHVQKISTDGGWNFRLNLTKYPGWFVWYAHPSCSTCFTYDLTNRICFTVRGDRGAMSVPYKPSWILS